MKAITILFLAALFSATALAKDSMRLAAPFFPPYAYFDIDGNLSGAWIRQLQPVLEDAGIEFVAISTPMYRFYSAIGTGRVDISALPKGKPGMENVLFSGQPFSHFDLRIFWKDDKPEIQNIRQLAGQRVALIRGYSYGGYLEESLSEAQRDKFVVVKNQMEAIKLLEADEADYVLGYWAMMDYLSKNFPDTQLNNHKISEIPIYFAIHNSVDNAEEIMQRFEASLSSAAGG